MCIKSAPYLHYKNANDAFLPDSSQISTLESAIYAKKKYAKFALKLWKLGAKKVLALTCLVRCFERWWFLY